jgi:hypothetical protein
VPAPPQTTKAQRLAPAGHRQLEAPGTGDSRRRPLPPSSAVEPALRRRCSSSLRTANVPLSHELSIPSRVRQPRAPAALRMTQPASWCRVAHVTLPDEFSVYLSLMHVLTRWYTRQMHRAAPLGTSRDVERASDRVGLGSRITGLLLLLLLLLLLFLFILGGGANTSGAVNNRQTLTNTRPSFHSASCTHPQSPLPPRPTRPPFDRAHDRREHHNATVLAVPCRQGTTT